MQKMYNESTLCCRERLPDYIESIHTNNSAGLALCDRNAYGREGQLSPLASVLDHLVLSWPPRKHACTATPAALCVILKLIEREDITQGRQVVVSRSF